VTVGWRPAARRDVHVDQLDGEAAKLDALLDRLIE
jgi:hypothetical protein